MAFVPGFEHDVFISYAHANNERLTKEDEGYVTKFHENLTQFLTAELGRREYFSIWLDQEELRGNDDFEVKLNMSFVNSAVLVSICSQSYVESAWCRRELLTFSSRKHPTFALKLNDAGPFRVFRIDLGDVVEPHPEIPSFFFERMLGHKFYETEDGVDLPFRRSDPDDDDQRYWKAMRGLAHNIAQLLRQMKKMAQPAVNTVTLPSIPGRTVFLAETADDLEDQRTGVKSALEQHSQAKSALTGMGLRVLPEFPLSLGDPNLIEDLRTALRSADMSVHLIGPLAGKTPLNETRSLVRLQWELASEVAREKPLPRVAWLCDGLDPTKVKEQHRAFLQSLEEAGGAAPPEVLRIGIEELRELLLGRLFPPAPPKGVEEQEETEEEIDRLVYLTYLPEDRDGAVKLKEALRRERLDVKLFRYEDRDPQMLARIHNASLEKSDGVIIFYGTNALWLDQLIEEARDTLKARAKKNPLKVVCICDGPPNPKDSPIDVDYDKFIVADCRDGVEAKDLKSFVELIKS